MSFCSHQDKDRKHGFLVQQWGKCVHRYTCAVVWRGGGRCPCHLFSAPPPGCRSWCLFLHWVLCSGYFPTPSQQGKGALHVHWEMILALTVWSAWSTVVTDCEVRGHSGSALEWWYLAFFLIWRCSAETIVPQSESRWERFSGYTKV